jgi:hypothetical protein
MVTTDIAALSRELSYTQEQLLVIKRDVNDRIDLLEGTASEMLTRVEQAVMGTRADVAKELAKLREETKADFAKLREEMATKADFAKLREEMATKADFAKLREEMATKADLANMQMNLVDCLKHLEENLRS